MDTEIYFRKLPGFSEVQPDVETSYLESYYPDLTSSHSTQLIPQLVSHYNNLSILYESPFRLLKTLQQLAEVCGPERKVSVSRELTKIHEENARGTLAEVIEHFSKKEIKGEIVIVLEGTDGSMAEPSEDDE